jgi:hypothetical protein
MEVFKDKSDDEEVRGDGDGIYTQRGEFAAQSYPEEEVEQRDVQAVVEEVGASEANAVFRRGLFVEGEMG